MVIDLTGNVGIGKTGPSYTLDVNGPVQATVFYYSSDRRWKENIQAITNPLDKILALNGYSFDWKKTGKKDIGIIAQEVEKVFPELVATNNEGYKSVEYANLVAPLIEAIKELNTKVESQAKQIQTLQNSIK